MRLMHRGLLLVGVPFMLTVLIVGAMFALIVRTDRERVEEAKYRRIAEGSARSYLLLFDASYSVQQVAHHHPEYKKIFKQDIEQLFATKEELTQALEETGQAEVMHDLNALFDDTMDSIRELLDVLKSRRIGVTMLQDLGEMLEEFGLKSYEVCRKLDKVGAESVAYLDALPEKEAGVFKTQCAVLAGGLLLSLLSAFVLARWFGTHISSRLLLINDNSVRLSKEYPLNPLLAGSDEIAELDKEFHLMAESLSSAIARERAVFQAASDIICMMDRDFSIIAINPAVTRVLDYETHELIGVPLTTLVHEEDREATLRSLSAVLEGNRTGTCETRVKHKDESDLHLLWSLFWAEQEETLYAVAHDISERKQVETAKQEFLGMISHDLRSPLTSIYGTFQLMGIGVFGKLSDVVSQTVTKACDDINGLIKLVNDLLDIDKLEAGKLQLEHSPISVSELLSRAQADVAAHAEERNVTIETVESEAEVSVDADRLVQALGYLLNNAIDLSPPGSIVRMDSDCNEQGVTVGIHIEGRSTNDRSVDLLFERFKQATDAPGSKRSAGSGIELAICKQIIEQHEGTITVTEAGRAYAIALPSELALAARKTRTSTAMPTVQSSNTEQSAAPAPEPSQRAARGRDMPIFYKGLVLVVVPVVFELCFAGSLFASLNDAYQEKRQEQHVRALCTNACHLIILYYETGLIMNLQLGSETWNKYLETVGRINQAETKLITMTTVDPEANKLAREFVESVGPLHEFISHSQDVVAAGGTSEFNLREAFKGRDRLEPTLIKAKDKLNALIDQVLNSTQANPDRLMHKRGDQAVLLLGGLAISFVISLGSAYFFSFAFTRRLGLLRENARRLRLGQDLLPPLQGTDELAHLDNVFRSMAASIEKLRQRQRAVFDNSSDIICTIQPSGVVSAINPACLRIWGYDPSELAGVGILSFMVESDRANAQLALLNCSDSAPAQFFEARMTRKDGTMADMLWSLSYAQSGGGLFVLTAHDITARKEMQRLKQEFISMVSQDMRAPLLEVHHATHRLVAGEIGELSEKATTQLQGVERNCERLLDLINDLLEIDKLESGEFQLAFAEGSAADVLKQTQTALENLAGQRGISIVIDSPDPIAFDVDAKRVMQVAVNLLSNAIKFSPDNSTVTLSAVRIADSVEISVIDQGRGIPDAMCTAVFEKYKQVEKSDGKRNKGTGLGLPICKSIIEQHGGQIGVESEVGRGSRFWFRLPLKQRTAVH